MRVRTWLIVVAGVAVLVAVLMPATAHWSGAMRVEVAVEVVDRASGRAIPGATVEFVHPYDPDRAPVGGRTGPDGRVSLPDQFPASGTESLIGRTTRVTFNPWLVRVAAPGWRTCCASIAVPSHEPTPGVTDPPLGLRYPLAGPIRVGLVEPGGGGDPGL